VTENSRIPVPSIIKGSAYAYVDKYADIKTAIDICINSKVQRPGVCNAMETMLVHKDIAEEFMPEVAKAFRKAMVEIRGCEKDKSPYT
jgi:glutamate-5-semialdehyde dehydrogenase